MHLLKTKQETKLIDISQTQILIKILYLRKNNMQEQYVSQRQSRNSPKHFMVHCAKKTLTQSSFSSGLRIDEKLFSLL